MSVRERRSITGLVILLGVMLIALGFMVGLSVGSADASERTDQRNMAILDVVAGDYGPYRGELTDYEFGVLVEVYGVAERTGAPCWTITAQLIATRDYVPYMAQCLGDEDSAAVDVILG